MVPFDHPRALACGLVGYVRAQGCAMSYESDTAGRYRVRARELRLIGKKYQDRETTRTLAWIAQEYEIMARIFDDIDGAGLAAFGRGPQTNNGACDFRSQPGQFRPDRSERRRLWFASA